MKNKIEDLRNHLFAQLERLSDDEVDIEKEKERSKQIIEVANSILDVGKLEIDFIKAIDGELRLNPDFFSATIDKKEIAK